MITDRKKQLTQCSKKQLVNHIIKTVAVPFDYEQCGYCGYDHGYEPKEAMRWHKMNPGMRGGY
jgi:hypothetical protein